MRADIVDYPIQQPAAGADWSFTPSNVDRVKLLCVTARLVTSATAANRLVKTRIRNKSATAIWIQGPMFYQLASLTADYSWAQGASNTVSAAVLGGSAPGWELPDLWLLDGDVFGTVTAAIDTADQWSNIYARCLVSDDEWYREYLLRQAKG